MRLGSLREKATRGGSRETVVREERVAPCTSRDSALSSSLVPPPDTPLLSLPLGLSFVDGEAEAGGRKAVMIATG